MLVNLSQKIRKFNKLPVQLKKQLTDARHCIYNNFNLQMQPEG